MSNPLKFLIIFLLFIGVSVYMFYSNIMQPDPNRITTNENGEEVVVFNELEKQLIGKWFIASVHAEGETKRSYKRIEKSYTHFDETGMKRNYWRKGVRDLMQFKVNPQDSIVTFTRGDGEISKGRINSISAEELRIHYFVQSKMAVRESDVVLRKY